MVDVRINGGASARLLLDTGADRTLIGPRALVAAGVGITRPIATGKVTGVTGTERIDYVMLDSLEVGEARVTRLPVMVYEMAAARGDGLLGRDFLDRFNLSLDANRGEVTLTPK
jgi:predicted aspartyl protease